jgi:hypothetical protein
MRGDYEEMEPAEDSAPFDWQWVLIIFLMIALFVGSCFMSGVADAADPVDVALAELKAEKAVRAALKGTPAAGRGGDVSAPPPVVIVPGRWVLGPDGLWRFHPTAAEVRAPRPFPVPPSTPTTPVVVGPQGTLWTAPARRPALIRIGASGAATSGFTNCPPSG